MERAAEIDARRRRVRDLLAGLDNVHLSVKSGRQTYYQALLSLGDRRVAPVIEAAERNGGDWRAAVADSGIDADFYLFRDRSCDEILPWDVIDAGLRATFFRSEYDKSLREEWTLPLRRLKENEGLLPTKG
jgi:hypothetical protein